MAYDKESFETDCDWLQEQGINTIESEDFIISLIRKGFTMTRSEYVEFEKMIKNQTEND